MGVICVYDWDFFHYSHVIPNLECAKLVAYNREKRHNVAVFKPSLETSMYTNFILRKDYDDGIYIPELMNANVEFGGMAFSSKYIPYDLACERIAPDFSIYNDYKDMYGQTKKDKDQIKKILFATHARISLDGTTLESFPFDRLEPSHAGAILHDYDLASIPDAPELCREICSRRSSRPYGIGNKFPIEVDNFNTLKQWLNLTPMPDLFFIKYNNIFTDEQLINLVEENLLQGRQLCYNFCAACKDEDDFMVRVLPEIYRHLLFLRRNKINFLLYIDDNFFKTQVLVNLIILFNLFCRTYNDEKNIMAKRTLYAYCSNERMKNLQLSPWRKPICLTLDEMRECFQYVRLHNYEVFDMFYSVPEMTAKGGQLVYDRK